jgi:hypothetical protein
MKQKLYLVLLLLSLTLSGNAEEKWCLVVENASGVKTAIGIDQEPVITPSADGYSLTYGAVTTQFTWSESVTMTIEQTEPTPTGIKEVKGTSFQLAPGEVAMKNATPGSMAQIVTIGGRQVKAVRVADDGTVTLSTAGLPAGIYIIKTNKSSFKFIKK